MDRGHGVLFRLHGMAVDGSMPGLKEADKKLLIKCKAKILKLSSTCPPAVTIWALYTASLAHGSALAGGSGELTMRR